MLLERVDEAGEWLVAGGIAPAALAEAFAMHRSKCASGELIKNGRKRRLSRVRVGGASLVVKEYARSPWPRRWRSDARGWLGLCRLYALGFEVPKPVAWLRAKTGRGCVLLEDAGQRHLPDAVAASSDTEAAEMVAEAARMLARLHGSGICHGDTKPTNFVVGGRTEKGNAHIRIVDCDAVSFSRRDRSGRMDRERQHFLDTFPGGLAAGLARAFNQAYGRHRRDAAF
jgi:RIO-like serine/threonine protein kinase